MHYERTQLGGEECRKPTSEAFAVNNILSDNRALEGRVIYEEIPSGENYLIPILDAMRMNKVIDVAYASFRRTEPVSYRVEPYAVRMHHRRWYLLARECEGREFRHLALDRMKEVNVLDAEFTIDPAFDLDAYYDGAFGVITGMEDDYDIEDIRIKVYNDFYRADYLRTLPLHSSQKEVETYQNHAVFSYRLRPTNDFLSALLVLGCDAEVLAPEWFREYVCTELIRVLRRYGR